MNRKQRRVRRDGPAPRSFGMVVDLHLPTLDRGALEATLDAWKAEFNAAALAGRFVVIAGRPGAPGCLAMGLAEEANLEFVFVSVNETIGRRFHADGQGVTAWAFLVDESIETRLREAVAGQLVH